MNKPDDIEVIRRKGHHASSRFEIVIWANSMGECTIEAIELEGLPLHKVVDWTLFNSIDAAYRHGCDLAKRIIDAG